MNYNRLNKSQLIETLNSKDEEISKLVDHIIKVEQTNSDRIQTLKKEANLFVKDFISLIRFVYENGCKARRALGTISKPILISKT